MLFNHDISEIMDFNKFLENKGISLLSVDTYMKDYMSFIKSNPNFENLNDYNTFLIDHSVKKRNNHVFAMMKHFIEFKVKDPSKKEMLLKNIVRPRIHHDLLKTKVYLNEDKILEVINNMEKYKHKIVAIIQTFTGLRAGDVLRMKRGDILMEDYKNKVVMRINAMAKRGRRYVVHILDEVAINIILEYINKNFIDERYYFLEPSTYSKTRPGLKDIEFEYLRMNYQWYLHDLKSALKLSNVDIKEFATHDFRRCFARRAWEKFKDLWILQKLLNHLDPKVTMRYLDQSGMKNIEYLYEMQVKG